jgi:hypothetical protein
MQSPYIRLKNIPVSDRARIRIFLNCGKPQC